MKKIFYTGGIISLCFFYGGYKTIVRTIIMSCWTTYFTEHRSVGAFCSREGMFAFSFLEFSFYFGKTK